jgi:hypothetical protein
MSYFQKEYCHLVNKIYTKNKIIHKNNELIENSPYIEEKAIII